MSALRPLDIHIEECISNEDEGRGGCDKRAHEFVVGPRAVTLTDGMTAGFYRFDRSFPGTMATCIANEVKGGEPGGVRRDEQAARDD
jgi:hypothetical protein